MWASHFIRNGNKLSISSWLASEVQVCRNVGRPNPRLPNLVFFFSKFSPSPKFPLFPPNFYPNFEHFPIVWFGWTHSFWDGICDVCIWFWKPPTPLRSLQTFPIDCEHIPIVRFGWNLLYRLILGCHLWRSYFFFRTSPRPWIPSFPSNLFSWFWTLSHCPIENVGPLQRSLPQTKTRLPSGLALYIHQPLNSKCFSFYRTLNFSRKGLRMPCFI